MKEKFENYMELLLIGNEDKSQGNIITCLSKNLIDLCTMK